MLTTFDRYLLKRILAPLVVTLGIAALLLILERMLRLFDFVVNEGGPVGIVFQMLANLTPHYMGLALPVGLLLGVLIAFRQLSLSSEFDAATASGLGLPRLMRPVLGLSVLLMLVNILLVGWVQPLSRYTYRELVFDLRSGALGASVRVGEFVEIGDNLVLRIEESRNQGSELIGVFLERRAPERSMTVSAERGSFLSTQNQNIIILRLFNGKLVDLNERQNKPRVLNFEQQDLTIRLPTGEPFRGRGGEEREMTLSELYRERHNPTFSIEQQAAFNANFHWRLMHSITFLIIPFLAAPLGITNRRQSNNSGLIMGLSVLILYNELMEGMETAVQLGASPYLTIWALFAVLCGLAALFFNARAFKSGGDPLSWINWLWSRTMAPLKTLLARLLGMG